ncbi:tRNA (N6-threonylcarbamoyladenosine(37)-N6)-methyltransferase TrmO [Desulfosarcina alkanivorans]|uniref:tRNA (N6-threonylcarbamoyladenosine(37)-N6)-methyltransferase TrmO n=1 Tax=Desulfosarcina alkanivorans TaxID=571177 RepID=A0A5K7YSQ7_9BACT|nr:tRNA (N6-threonylcarbamoyladenosine(37)-N6)-methyltransferase TrmO [Desulfosarcina alkanivorans]BBO71009.1 tRNA (N6-threonylcarbamoyladenosine(37)-N6)-methyltransferase TrmO [Desulfosarcina alkanivorans]
MQTTFSAIGTIHTPFTRLEGMPIQPSGAREVKGTIILEPQYEEGLRDLDGFSHIILIYHFHRSKGYRLTVKPFLDNVARGLFATRAPRRPNPIGLSIVELVRIEGPNVHVRGIDVLDGTPLLDIKPWVPTFDVRENVRAGWLDKNQKNSRSIKSDHRFVESRPEE